MSDGYASVLCCFQHLSVSKIPYWLVQSCLPPSQHKSHKDRGLVYSPHSVSPLLSRELAGGTAQTFFVDFLINSIPLAQDNNTY